LPEAIADGDLITPWLKLRRQRDSAEDRLHGANVQGQAQVIAAAQALAGVEPDTISYVEAPALGPSSGIHRNGCAHTGVSRRPEDRFLRGGLGQDQHRTPAPPPAWRASSRPSALEHRQLPPSLHYEAPNQDRLRRQPVLRQREATDWPERPMPRRRELFGSAVPSAHVLLEEHRTGSVSALGSVAAGNRLGPQRAALDTAAANLRAHLEAHPHSSRRRGVHAARRAPEVSARRAVACRNVEDAVSALAAQDRRRVPGRSRRHGPAASCFHVPGQRAART
jgi:acyl transferase domain-containing protein